MAGRVNVKFVVTLSAGLLIAFGVVAMSAVLLLKNSAKDLAAAGDKAMAAGETARAIEAYSKAVNKEQTNSEYINKWRNALRSMAPDNPVVYRDYFDQLQLANRQAARTTDVNEQRQYLQLLREQLPQQEFSRAAHDRIISEATALIDVHATAGNAQGGDVIRRFRGMSQLEIFAFVPDARPEIAEEAQADFEAALAADPADHESAAGLYNLHLIRAERSAERGRDEEALAFEAAADKVLTDFVAANPDEPFMGLVMLRRDLNRAQRKATAARGDTPLIEIIRTLQDDFRPRLDAVMQSIRTNTNAQINGRLVDLMRGVEGFIDPASQLARSEEVCRLGIERQPSNFTLMLSRADIAAAREEYTVANELLQRIVDAPLPTTSLDGLRLFGLKTSAIFLQAINTSKAALAADADAKTALIAKAKDLRKALAARESPDSAPMLFVDAQIAFVEADHPRANQLLERYFRITRERTNPEALMLGAMVADRLNQTGLARSRLDELLRISPGRPAAVAYLADIEARLQNFDRAVTLYEQLLQIAPNSEPIRQRIETIRVIQGRAVSSDPVVATLRQAQDLTNPPAGRQARPEEVIPFLRRAVEQHNHDWRIVVGLGNALLRDGKRDEAVSLVTRALEIHPAEPQLLQYQLAVTAVDNVAARIAVINATANVPELDKIMARYAVYRGAGRADEAKAEMAQAVQMSPNDPRVVEYRFLDALDEKNWTLAGSLTDAATRENMDQADGLTFRARLLAAQGNVREAVTAIEGAVAKGGAQPEVWRLKGRMENVSGRKAEAVASFRQAARLQPDNIATINDLLISLTDLGRNEEALSAAREYERYARDDPNFLNMWMALEAAVGSKTAAIERRENIARATPTDRANLVALASLYVSERDWNKARPTIERARTLSDGVDVLSLDAAVHWEQGDRERARALFADFISASSAENALRAHLLYAQFLAQRDDFETAIAVLERARALQDPKTAEADRALLDVFMRLGNYEQTAMIARRIITSGNDSPDHIYRKRLIEALIKLGNFTDAETELGALIKLGEPDMLTLLLQADIYGGLNDARTQRSTLDRATARFPNEPMVFLKRGQSLLGDPRTARDAISDFNRAIQLRPDMWQAFRMRAAANVTLDQVEEAVNDLRAALKIAPRNDELLYGLLSDLLRMGGRVNDALDIATQALSQRPRDVNAMVTIGQIMASSGFNTEAARFFRQAFEIDTSDAVAQRYLDSLLNATPPDVNEARRVIDRLGPQRVTQNPGFLMALAKISMRMNRVAEANAAARDALRLLRTDEPLVMLAWFNDLRRLIPEKQNLIKYLDETSKLAAASRAQEWLRYFVVSVNLDDPSTRSSAMPAARDLLAEAEDLSIRQLLYRSLGSALYGAGEYQEAARLMREGLGQFSNDVEMTNNLAFILATRLDRAAEAVDLAEKAASLTPAVADVQDTLGTVYLKNKRYDDAAAAFRRAILLASTPHQTVSFTLHLADTLHEAGKREEARRALTEAAKAADGDPAQIGDELRERLADLRKKIEAP
jgi:tetratricopeptide (TPR) repeat protein